MGFYRILESFFNVYIYQTYILLSISINIQCGNARRQGKISTTVGRPLTRCNTGKNRSERAFTKATGKGNHRRAPVSDGGKKWLREERGPAKNGEEHA